MKYLIIFLVLFSVTHHVYSQQSVEPFKNANQILIYFNEDPANFYKQIQIALLENNYSIQSKDADLNTINTDFKGFSHGRYKITVLVKQNYAVIFGEVVLESGFGNATYQLEYKNSRTNSIRKAWDCVMDDLKDVEGERKYRLK